MIRLAKTDFSNQFFLSINDSVFPVLIIGINAFIFRDIRDCKDLNVEPSINKDGSTKLIGTEEVYAVISKDFLLGIESVNITYDLENVLLWRNDPLNYFSNFGVDIISPDGFSFFIDGPKKDIAEAEDAFSNLFNAYEKQGYYSSNRGRISMENFKIHCHFCITEIYNEEFEDGI